ncbi:MAG: FAD-binding oxidoreductase [Candidatus Zambryskibacteria bacterium]|nr:FAD-binding oxidoreductase [Candidatus Zambryskibacteria bacterium]
MENLLNNDPKVLEGYSRDASLFRVLPKFVAFPKNVEDIKKLVKFATEHKESLTVRAGGTDMTGGPLNESIIVDVTKYINKIGEIDAEGTSVEPGAFYRDFEKRTLAKKLILPCYTASKNLCALGGMIANNCGGQMSLRYGKMENFVVESKWVFADGNEYVIKRGAIDNEYSKRIFELIKQNREIIKNAKPKVSKNSAGYYLWNVLSRALNTGGEVFDLNKLLVGSQGTLGIMTEAKVSLVPVKAHHDLIAIFFSSWDDMPGVVNTLLPYEPESLETFDKDTIKLGIRFMPEIAKKTGSNLFSFAAKFLPEAFIGIKMGGLPELVVLVEIAEESESEVKRKVKGILESLRLFKVWHRVVEKDSEEEKFWIVRRESFNLLREHVKNKRTAPFIDDFCIPVEKVPEFLPKAKKILEDYDIDVNIAGHAGNGNFHIIPLMNLKLESERKKLIPVANKFYDLVSQYHGSITGEHNDGIIRTPYLDKMYSPEVLELFKKVKQIFDPQNIFNPNKKVNGTLEYLENHIETS